MRFFEFFVLRDLIPAQEIGSNPWLEHLALNCNSDITKPVAAWCEFFYTEEWVLDFGNRIFYRNPGNYIQFLNFSQKKSSQAAADGMIVCVDVDEISKRRRK